MLKFLLILFLVGYVIFKIGGFFFKLFLTGLSNGQRHGNFNPQSHQQAKRRAPGSNLNIDHVPQGERGNKKGPQAGDYVDYEEVK